MKNEKGFVIFPVLIIVGLVAGFALMTAPNSIKASIAKAVHLEK
jgi:uncharacterized membrane protein